MTPIPVIISELLATKLVRMDRVSDKHYKAIALHACISMGF